LDVDLEEVSNCQSMEFKNVNPRLDFKYDIENIHRYIKSTRVSYLVATFKGCLTRRRRNEEQKLFK
jgi:hypothetical protein